MVNDIIRRWLYNFVYFLLIATLKTCCKPDTITPSQSMKDGQNLVSAGGSFELGFFSPKISGSRYLGIWYTVSRGTVVWVANRETPLQDHSGVLHITLHGILVLLNRTKDVVWNSSNASGTSGNPVAQLLDSGNLVVKDSNEDNLEKSFWQSFDYPSDTILPGMKLGWNLETGLNRFVTSWKSTDDPATGQFSQKIDPRGLPQSVLWNGPKIQFRAGSWNGLYHTGIPGLKSNPVYMFEFEFNEKEIYYRYELRNRSAFSRYILPPSGIGERLVWKSQLHNWEPFFLPQVDRCDNYAFCGANACCSINDSPECACLEGFEPKSPRHWNLQNWSDGCVRRTPLACEDEIGFLNYKGIKLPDTSSSWYNRTMNLKECENLCSKKCSCIAFANLDIREGGSGCVLWFDDLIDIRKLSDGGQEFYIRMAAQELDHVGKIGQISPKKKRKKVMIVAGSVMVAFGLIAIGLVLIKRKKKQGLPKESCRNHSNHKGIKEDVELPLFDLATIANATDNFSINNKLGQGGFGLVFKGTLIGGNEIAVKRLSKNSGQGLEEFKTEVKLIAKLQHCNLVKLLGYCIQGHEKLLIYEYMPNRSLDSFIFDHTRSKFLDWSRRIHIISGIARGLLYLHQDSRLRIVHRDLKASNILLDNEMNPKISDFGLARIFDRNQTMANTNRVIGTHGYMSPEYAVDGLFSVKSDVFSFGVLVLEIVSGKKNRGFCHPDHHFNLLGHAWKLWIEGRPLELIDGAESFTTFEVLRCIHVALICVQQKPEDRPNMSSVVLMLGSECSLPPPKQPGFFIERNSPVADNLSFKDESYSGNELTITVLEPR